MKYLDATWALFMLLLIVTVATPLSILFAAVVIITFASMYSIAFLMAGYVDVTERVKK